MNDTNHYKEKLLAEQKRLEEELSDVGRKNPQNPTDWEPTPDKGMENTAADFNVRADAVEEFEARTAVEVELENALIDVNAALEKIEKGTYGTCEIGGEEIEEDRLEAYPAAKTCKAHMG